MFDFSAQSFRTNADACNKFMMLNLAAFEKMRLLGHFVLIATNPNCFDDACDFPEWIGAQVDDVYWERMDYKRIREMGEPGMGRGKRSGRRVSGSARFPGVITRSSGHAPDAVDILQDLQAAKWRRWAERALGTSLDYCTLALVLHRHVRFICVSGSVGGGGGTWLVDRDDSLVFVAECDRIDSDLGEPGGPDIFGTLTSQQVEFLLDYMPDLLDDLDHEPKRDTFTRRRRAEPQ